MDLEAVRGFVQGQKVLSDLVIERNRLNNLIDDAGNALEGLSREIAHELRGEVYTFNIFPMRYAVVGRNSFMRMHDDSRSARGAELEISIVIAHNLEEEQSDGR